ncbi:MAG: DUF99 family protein [Candidatus Bathyarchaeia archaeon]
MRRFRVIKPEIRVLGVDDGSFKPRSRGFVPVVGVVFRGGYWLDGVMHTRVRVDGFDATEKITSMIISSSHYKQLRVIMLDGITLAGFNIVDIKRLNESTLLPVIAVTREKPDFKKIYEALKNLPETEKRWQAVLNAGEVYEMSVGEKGEKIYMQISGVPREDAEKIIRLTATRSHIPEALRVAHLIASGLNALRRKS